ncbi:hypothetical protein VCUG_02841 [Vavraia culicis subsp. floridensis]|uniref:Uncharacterized protein n=1 Tax=Vavraia culicis (isolate floridensis) TaxID=948595 RepID=A0A024RE31_VAVCU|nr:uncharacterized protein VCUG_02841 [Vavraia culicis subsp. floridensis]ETA55723.1 hypothetical protein VCUG_02841 [Vavraia culicis subsp. floridensis]
MCSGNLRWLPKSGYVSRGLRLLFIVGIYVTWFSDGTRPLRHLVLRIEIHHKEPSSLTTLCKGISGLIGSKKVNFIEINQK